MRKNHAAAAVALEAQSVECIALRKTFVLQEREVRLPFVADDFAARETTHRNDHD